MKIKIQSFAKLYSSSTVQPITNRLIYSLLKKNCQIIEDCAKRTIFVTFNDHGIPFIIIYRSASIQQHGEFIVYTKQCTWAVFPKSKGIFRNFSILNGTLSASKNEKNYEIPLQMNDLPKKIQKEIIHSICHRAFAFGIIRFFLKKYVHIFIGRPVMPSGRLGYHLRKGMEACNIDYPNTIY
jgi:hypothetical protein